MRILTDFDLYLFGQGTHRQAYEKLGAHLSREGDREGVHFAVWAPNARRVSVVGNFNGWTPDVNWLRPTEASGIWQGFVPDIGVGTVYKFAIQPIGASEWLFKADPFAFAAERRPNTASIVADLDSYSWDDGAWMERRRTEDWSRAPISIYEVHLGSWRRDPSEPYRQLSYGELADQLPEYCASLGFTHVELMPILEHPLDRSWGYQVTGYFAPTARYGTPIDFMKFVDRCHQAGLGVFLDWVPAHFPKDAHGLARFDGTHLYEHADPRQGEHPDWGTLVFNYGRNEVRSFLISNAVFWLDRYHVDGLRVDAVASMLYRDYSRQEGQWVPNIYGGRENLEAISLLRDANDAVHKSCPGTLTIAEESTAWPRVTGPTEEGGLGFDLKWNMGWMHDTLAYMGRDPIYRRFHQNELTFSLVYAFSERYVLPLSHDEVVHGKRSLLGKMPGDAWQKFANLRLLYAYLFGHPGKKLLFMGAEIGQLAEWNFEQSVDWHLLDLPGVAGERHRGLKRLLGDLNRLYSAEPALHEGEDWQSFQWIDFKDAENSVLAFLRRTPAEDKPLIFVCNFTPVVREGYRVGLPSAGWYRTILNTDETKYGGSGVGHAEPVEAESEPWQDQPFSVPLTLPPLAAVVLRPDAP